MDHPCVHCRDNEEAESYYLFDKYLTVKQNKEKL